MKLTIKVIVIMTKIIMTIITIKCRGRHTTPTTTIKVIVIITKIIMTIITIKCRGRHTTPATTITELPVTLHNGRKPLSNIKKSSPSDAVRVLYAPLKRLIHHLT